MIGKEFKKWLKKNKKELREFINLEFNTAIDSCYFDWHIDVKISYNDLTPRQKTLADQMRKYMREIDLGIK